MRSLSGGATDSTGISLLMSDLIAQFTGSAEEIAAAQDRYYRFVLERLMDGLDAGLAAGLDDGLDDGLDTGLTADPSA